MKIFLSRIEFFKEQKSSKESVMNHFLKLLIKESIVVFGGLLFFVVLVIAKFMSGL